MSGEGTPNRRKTADARILVALVRHRLNSSPKHRSRRLLSCHWRKATSVPSCSIWSGRPSKISWQVMPVSPWASSSAMARREAAVALAACSAPSPPASRVRSPWMRKGAPVR